MAYILFLLQVKNSIMLGAQYALIAIGFTLFFGVLNVVVFCQGGFYILAVFISAGLLSLLFSAGPMSPILLSTLIFLLLFTAMATTGLVGLVVERTTIRPFRNAPLVMPILSTIAVGIVIEQLLKIFYPQGSNPQVFPDIFPATGVNLGAFYISLSELVIIGVTVAVFVGIYLFIRKTRMGSQVMAISQDFEAAAMIGINVNRAIAVTFFLGASLAAIAGFMNGVYYTVFRYDMGAMAGIKGFSAAVVGGLGSVYGAVIGGFLMGFVETFAAAYIPGGSAIRDVFSFGVLLLFLLIRPSGILGEKVIDKV
jgi:branched-chain amino acid transport system permease protein